MRPERLRRREERIPGRAEWRWEAVKTRSVPVRSLLGCEAAPATASSEQDEPAGRVGFPHPGGAPAVLTRRRRGDIGREARALENERRDDASSAPPLRISGSIRGEVQAAGAFSVAMSSPLLVRLTRAARGPRSNTSPGLWGRVIIGSQN